MRRLILLVALWATLGAFSATAGMAAVNSVRQATGQLAVQPLSEGDVQRAVEAAATPGEPQVELPLLPGLPAPATSKPTAVAVPVLRSSANNSSDSQLADQNFSGGGAQEDSGAVDSASQSPQPRSKPSTAAHSVEPSNTPEPTRTPDPAEASTSPTAEPSTSEGEPAAASSSTRTQTPKPKPSSEPSRTRTATKTRETNTRSIEPRVEDPGSIPAPAPSTTPAP